MRPAQCLALVILTSCVLLSSRASDFVSLDLLTGGAVTVGGERSKPLYLKFWASWCGQCMAQMPHLQLMHQTYRDRVDVIAVNFGLDDTVEKIDAVRRRFGMTVPIGFDEAGVLRTYWLFIINGGHRHSLN